MANPAPPANAAAAATADGGGDDEHAALCARAGEKFDAATRGDVEDGRGQVWLVSACLLGTPCRYDGHTAKATAQDAVSRIPANATILPCCPEQEGGLPTPRPAAHLVGGDGAAVLDGTAQVLTEDGVSVTEAFLAGARNAAALAESKGATHALLKARSPSCGSAQVYLAKEGPAALTAGEGVTAALLRRRGLRVLSDEEISVAEASQSDRQEVDARQARKHQ